jgi:MOSC domain-containing protein YiiM
MAIVRLYTCAPGETAQRAHPHVEVIAGKGIVGDRYFDRHEEPGQSITLIEAEEIEAALAEWGLLLDLSVTGRNVVTRGVRLNALVGRDFRIGAVRLRGAELCEPCLGLGEALAGEGRSPAAVVKRLLHRGGLRADVLAGGTLTLGQPLAVDAA